jgi:predicted DNA-binding ribbon-helix-helix protein
MIATAYRNAQLAPVDDRLLPRFRVLTLDGVRRAFKLEPIYWSALGVLASRRRRTLAEEVLERLKYAPPGANLSAFLRASIAGDLYDLFQAQQARPPEVGWAEVVDAIAEPAFAATLGGRLSAMNLPMRALLRSRGLACEDPSDVTLDLAPGAVALLRASGRAGPVVCNAGFRLDGRRVSCRVRIVPSTPGASNGAECPLIGFSAPPGA